MPQILTAINPAKLTCNATIGIHNIVDPYYLEQNVKMYLDVLWDELHK